MSDTDPPKRHDPTARERHRRYREKLRAAFAAQNAPSVANVGDVDDVVNGNIDIDQIAAWWDPAPEQERHDLIAAIEDTGCEILDYAPDNATSDLLERYMDDMFEDEAAQRGYVQAPATAAPPRRWWR